MGVRDGEGEEEKESKDPNTQVLKREQLNVHLEQILSPSASVCLLIMCHIWHFGQVHTLHKVYMNWSNGQLCSVYLKKRKRQ